MPTFNSCTKCPGIIHERTPDCHPVSWAWMTSQLNLALIRKLLGSLMCLAYCYDMLSTSLYDQAMADVRSTGAEIKCLYCMPHLTLPRKKIHGLYCIHQYRLESWPGHVRASHVSLVRRWLSIIKSQYMPSSDTSNITGISGIMSAFEPTAYHKTC